MRQHDGLPGHEGGSRQTLNGVVSMKWPTLSKIVVVGHYHFVLAAKPELHQERHMCCQRNQNANDDPEAQS